MEYLTDAEKMMKIKISWMFLQIFVANDPWNLPIIDRIKYNMISQNTYKNSLKTLNNVPKILIRALKSEVYSKQNQLVLRLLLTVALQANTNILTVTLGLFI